MAMQRARSAYRRLPEGAKKPVRLAHGLLRRLRDPRGHTEAHWVTNEMGAFRLAEQKSIFLSIARYAHINRPIDGYYFEFGSHGATTMRMAYDAFHHLFEWTYVAFDSFEGMPEPAEIDRQAIWRKGMNRTSQDEFLALCSRHGVPADKLITVKGFYEDTLTDATKKRFLPRKAAVVYVDCDFYTSTVPVLSFVTDFLQRGTIVVFDDWNAYHGDPDKGERRAFREFREQQPDIVFEDFIQTAEAKAFICLGSR